MSSQLISVDLQNLRKDFPIFAQNVAYLDSAATSQKPETVLLTMDQYYKHINANVHRGVYEWSAKSTQAYENSRKRIADFLNAKPWEIIFTRNATEAINLVSRAWGDKFVKEGDIILATEMEHHSNLVPWQQLAKRKNAELKVIPITQEGKLDLTAAKDLIKGVKILAVTHVSNVLGTINPIKQLIGLAHENGAKVLIDACQSIPHLPVDVKELDADFLVCSGHKVFGPTGIGFLYGKEEILNSMDPFLFGGDMIKTVSIQDATWNELPNKFEAGTPAIAEAIGLGAAFDYLNTIGMQVVAQNDRQLIEYALKELQKVEGVTIYGPKNAKDRCGVVSFNLDNIHPHDLASILDEQGVAIRAGHHCCMPLMKVLNVTATARLSIALYNTTKDIDKLIKGLQEAKKVFK